MSESWPTGHIPLAWRAVPTSPRPSSSVPTRRMRAGCARPCPPSIVTWSPDARRRLPRPVDEGMVDTAFSGSFRTAMRAPPFISPPRSWSPRAGPVPHRRHGVDALPAWGETAPRHGPRGSRANVSSNGIVKLTFLLAQLSLHAAYSPHEPITSDQPIQAPSVPGRDHQPLCVALLSFLPQLP
jgi:hypothetical protein